MTSQIVSQTTALTQAFMTGSTPLMSSMELLEMVNESRARHGESEVRRNDFTARCKDELDGEYYETFVVSNLRGPASEALLMTKDQCLLVAMRESKAVRRQVVAKLNGMESRRAQPVELTRMDLIQLALAAEQEKILIAAERDQAVATKAQIGSRREATAMATAAKAVRETAKLRDELGRNKRHATVIAVERATGLKFAKNAYVALRKWCKKNDASAVDVVDARYGSVKAWPAGAWLAEFDIDLGRLSFEGAPE